MPRGVPKSGVIKRSPRTPRVDVKCYACGRDLVRTVGSMQGAKKIAYCNLTCSRSRGYAEGSGRPPRLQIGSKRIGSGGYVLIFLGYGVPGTYAQNGCMLEHRWIMEQQLGRSLLVGENVHHKNGVKTDNRIENLELWCCKQPRGQRVSDLAEYARDILALYGDVDELVAH